MDFRCLRSLSARRASDVTDRQRTQRLPPSPGGHSLIAAWLLSVYEPCLPFPHDGRPRCGLSSRRDPISLTTMRISLTSSSSLPVTKRNTMPLQASLLKKTLSVEYRYVSLWFSLSLFSLFLSFSLSIFSFSLVVVSPRISAVNSPIDDRTLVERRIRESPQFAGS
jgi:hypothetical protein